MYEYIYGIKIATPTPNVAHQKRKEKMKLLTLNFLTCARKTCKSTPAAFPLHPKEAELEQVEIDLNALFITNMLPRLDWEAMKTLTTEVYIIPTVLFLKEKEIAGQCAVGI